MLFRSGYTYVKYGPDNKQPFEIIDLIGMDEVMSQNKLFNVLTCYGSGQRYIDYNTKKPTDNKDIKKWMLHNNIPSFMLEQSTDIKYFFFCVSVIILSKDGKKINRLKHKEACYCRFEKADRWGKINHVFYANWRKDSIREEDVECIQLLDEHDPLGELEVLMGLAPGPDGQSWQRTTQRKFAVMVRFPTPGFRYYPNPYYTSIFRGDWFDIKRLIGKGKKAKLRNHAQIKYQVEIHKDFWENLLAEEQITDPLAQQERIKKEKQNIKDFVGGIENSGKVWITGFYIDPNGKENRMVRIQTIDVQKIGRAHV